MGQNKISNDRGLKTNLVNNLVEGTGSILALKPVAKYFTGARCILKVNGKILAFATGISWNITTAAEEVLTVDSYLPHELTPTRIQVNGTISGFRIPGDGPGAKLIQPDSLSFLQQNYVDIEVMDSQSDNMIFKTNKALITRRSESVRTGEISNLSLEFMAIGFIDERTNPRAPLERPKSLNSTTFLRRLIGL